MNAKIQRKLAQRKHRLEKRLDKTRFDGLCPMISASNIHYEISDRTQATAAGGIGVIHLLVKHLKLDQMINEKLGIFKIYLPYSESDHVLNIAEEKRGRKEGDGSLFRDHGARFVLPARTSAWADGPLEPQSFNGPLAPSLRAIRLADIPFSSRRVSVTTGSSKSGDHDRHPPRRHTQALADNGPTGKIILVFARLV